MLGRKDPLDAARADVEKAAQDAARWEITKATREVELADLEGRVGAELLAAEDGDAALAGASADVARLRSEIDMAERAAEVARHAVDGARRSALVLASAVVRRQADAKTAEADRRQKVTDELLGKLLEHEGVAYSTATIARLSPLSGAGSTTSVMTQPTITDGLRDEAAQLHARADDIDRLAVAAQVSPNAWLGAMAQADPEGPEAEARAAAVQQANATGEAAVARVRAINDARSEWIARRAAEIHAEGPLPADFAWTDAVFDRNAQERAQREFALKTREAPEHLEAQHEIRAWALRQLGVDVDALASA